MPAVSSDFKVESWQLKQRQSLPLESKVQLAQLRIRHWYEHWNGQVYVSFSGGKDSTVLLHLVRELYPKIPAVFANTGLQFPETVKFVRSVENVIELRPTMPFKLVLEKHGYPVVSKEQAQYIREYRNTGSARVKKLRWEGRDKKRNGAISLKWRRMIEAPFAIGERCCDVMKKRPFEKYERASGRKPYLGIMSGESTLRKQVYLRHGCNDFGGKRPRSRPLSVWLEEDIWAYIKSRGIKCSPVYSMGYERTGCIFCMFGVHLEKEPNRFQRLKVTHPKLWKYCMNKLGLREVLDYIGVPYK